MHDDAVAGTTTEQQALQLGTRTVLAMVVHGVFALLHGHGTWALSGWMAFCAGAFALGNVFGVYALAKGFFWARWFSLSIALVGVLNVIAVAPLWGPSWWAVGLPQGVLFALLGLTLLGRRMEAAFDRRPSPHNHWNWDLPSARFLRWATIVSFAAVPMLLLYAGSNAHWLTAGQRITAVVGMGLFAVGAGLVVMQRTLGLLMLLGGGAASAMLILPAVNALTRPACWQLGWERWAAMSEGSMVLSALLPAVLATSAALLVFAAPMARFLKKG